LLRPFCLMRTRCCGRGRVYMRDAKNWICHSTDGHGAGVFEVPVRISAKVFVEEARLPGAVDVKKLGMLFEEGGVVDKVRFVALLGDGVES